jgi:hypothetical protein
MALSHLIAGLLLVEERPNLVKLRHYLEGGVDALVERALVSYCNKADRQFDRDALLEKVRDAGSRVKVLANLNNLIALRVLDAETQTYITESLPKIRPKTIMRTQASSTQSDNPLLFSGNAGERLIEEEGELLPPALLGHLPNLEFIGRLAGGRTLKGRLPILVAGDVEAGAGAWPAARSTDGV